MIGLILRPGLGPLPHFLEDLCGRPSRSVADLPEVFPPMGPDRGAWGRGRGGWGRIPWPPSPRGPDRGHPCHGGAHPLAQPKGMAFFDGRDDPAVKKGQGRNGSAGSPGEDLGRPPAQFWKGCGRPPGKDASELAPVGAFVGGKRKGLDSQTLFSCSYRS